MMEAMHDTSVVREMNDFLETELQGGRRPVAIMEDTGRNVEAKHIVKSHELPRCFLNLVLLSLAAVDQAVWKQHIWVLFTLDDLWTRLHPPLIVWQRSICRIPAKHARDHR